MKIVGYCLADDGQCLSPSTDLECTAIGGIFSTDGCPDTPQNWGVGGSGGMGGSSPVGGAGGIGGAGGTGGASALSCVLDPGNTLANNVYIRNAVVAQTFAPAQTGILTAVVHQLRKGVNSVPSYDLLVTTTAGGVPTWFAGQPYASQGVLHAATGMSVFADSSSVSATVPVVPGVPVQAGNTYAVILVPTNSVDSMYWYGASNPASYANGAALEWNSSNGWVVPTIGPKDHGFLLEGLCP